MCEFTIHSMVAALDLESLHIKTQKYSIAKWNRKMVVRRYAQFAAKHKGMNRIVELLVFVYLIACLGLAISFASIFALISTALGLPLVLFLSRVQSYRNKYLGG